ncbi:MAG TPA: hypothetical protein PK450_06445 [Paracoccaceae bacterium]|nr:hypothetical protein [Paracoccaceae bacterium]
MNLHGSPLTILIIAALTCLPPFLALRLFVHSYRRALRRHMPAGRFLAAIGVSIFIFLFNLGALLITSFAMSEGELTLGRVQVVAIALAWIAFWIWLFLAFALGRDLGKRTGLR